MNKDWFVLIKKFTISGARDKFETICGTLFKKLYPNKNVRLIKVNQGDGGIDVLIGEIGLKPINVIQCKFFPSEFGESQKSQIRKSFQTAINSKEYKMHNWTLCVFCTLDLKENIWWVKWKEKMINTYNLSSDFIKLIDGDDLIDRLNETNLYNTLFEKEDSIKINALYESITPEITIPTLKKSSLKASSFLHNIKNYFGNEPTTHIKRKETINIINWIKSDLDSNKKNILILEGDKGLGKSVILKDVYDILRNENYLVFGIKSDKYYASSPKELENKIFVNENISFSKIIELANSSEEQFVLIFDQLDALSQTLSSNREYIQTYNRVINELIDEKNIRIIISTRTYDLKYDAELSIYKSNKYQKVRATLLNENDVRNTLNKFNVNCSLNKVIELLRTPNHLEIFCKLPNKQKLNLNALSSLKDLYDELWNTLILNKSELQLGNVLYTIADEMYKQQQIVVRSQIVSKFISELNYLFRNQLLTKENSNIQFFHQTFYDYCFARQFVENGRDIYIYLNQNQQNLEIRSVIKMVFEYLREYDPKKYIKYTKKILKSSKYRFHIKSLIINNLGLITPSTEEIEIVEKYILNNKTYEDVFINSVFSEKWVEYLIKNKTSDQYLFVKKKYKHSIYDIYKKQSFLEIQYFEELNIKKVIEYKRNAIWMLFRNNINKAPYQILTYLDNLPEFPNKHIFIERILYNLDNWDDERMLHYFQKYISCDATTKKRDDFWFYQILEKIFDYNSKYVFKKTESIFTNQFNNNDSWNSVDFSHYQEDLLKKMYRIAPDDSFDFLLNIYESVINENKETQSYEKIDSPFYKCNKFYDGISASKQGNIFIQEFLLNHLLTRKEQKEFFLIFYEKYKNSNSIYILRLIVLFLKESKLCYKDKVFEILNIVHSKNGFNGSDDIFQLSLRQLIGKTFILFSDAEKERIVDILLTIKHPYDLKGRKYKDSNGNEKVYFTGYGKKQYLFISSIPKEEINKHLRLKKVFQEFKRKFGIVNSNDAMDVSSDGAYVVGAPLELHAYTNMNLQSWKTSILKFNDNYNEGHGPKGGKLEHSRVFSDTVKEKPDKFYNFILTLFEDKNVSITYISSGINGLIDGEYNPEKVKILYKKLIKLKLDTTNTLYTIWKTGYLIKHKLIDEDIIIFLAENALNHPNPKAHLNENDPLLDSLNSVRGAAIHKIIKCFEYKEYSELIFETIEQATNDSQLSVKVAILQEIAFLNHIDIERSFKIFMKLLEENNIQLLKNSIRASQYFNNKYHDKMYSYFEKFITHKELHKDGHVIVLSWLFESINDKKLFERFFKSSKEAKLCAINVAEANLIDSKEKINIKSLDILKRLLKQKDKEFSSAYSGLILRKIKKNNFKQVYSFLILYSKTSLCMDEPRYFLMLLLTCTKDYPLECLRLLENMNFKRIPNIQESGHYREEPVQLVLAIYSKLNMDLKKNKKHVRKSLDIFDSMLKHNHLRASANKAIELTIS
ncbi:hypothetical protein [Lacinutrix salivirga]